MGNELERRAAWEAYFASCDAHLQPEHMERVGQVFADLHARPDRAEYALELQKLMIDLLGFPDMLLLAWWRAMPRGVLGKQLPADESLWPHSLPRPAKVPQETLLRVYEAAEQDGPLGDAALQLLLIVAIANATREHSGIGK